MTVDSGSGTTARERATSPGLRRRVLLQVAKKIYRATPSLRLRQVMFRTFLRLTRGRRLMASVDGFRFDLDLGEMIDATVYLQEYEPDVVAAINRYCRPGCTALDIGANIGAHTLRLARAVGSEGFVHAFEPTAYAFEKLRRNVALNPATNVSLAKVALADENAHGVAVHLRASWRTDGRVTNTEERIDFCRLDDWAKSAPLARLDFVKLDVDGGEYQVLRGGEEIIRRHRPVFVMEVTPEHFEDESRNPLRVLEALGYQFSNAKSRRLYERSSEIREDSARAGSVNVIALARGQDVRTRAGRAFNEATHEEGEEGAR